MVILGKNFDSLVRSYSKKGFTIVNGERQPIGIFNDTIYLRDGFSLLLERSYGDSTEWQNDIIRTYGNCVAGLIFETEHPDSLFVSMSVARIPVIPLEYSADSVITSFAIDSCHPVDIVFIRSGTRQVHDSAQTTHSNHCYRLDWVLLSAGERMKQIFRKIFELTATYSLHQGCCDYWRVGPANDFTFFRFETPLPKSNGDPYWLSIEADNFYFAY